ncbi:MAG: recombinase family protein [Bacteroidetes bacterium]|nr:recombinase family protein [Bacteroidota bacterium]
MTKAVSYYRVSTDKQGESGLGLDAQKLAVQQYAKANGLSILAEYTEIESGKNNKRPILLEAIEGCMQNNAVLLIAKLDRLGRNVAFISKLMESGIDFVAVDNPHANKLIVHILAAFAEHERDQISRRTKEALQVAKNKGVKLGTNAKELAKKNKARAITFSREMKPVIEELKNNGHETIRSIVVELNRLRIKTVTGKGRWHVHTVHRLLQHINKLK